MNYWLFQIMYDWHPDSWKIMVEAGLAAQHYPPGWTNERRNINKLCQLRRGDAIVAAFRKHRFAGYGTLTSDFYRGVSSLDIHDPDENRVLEFGERFKCDWMLIPFEKDPPFIDCHDLKRKGFDIDLERGSCVKKIDEDTFGALKSKLDAAGARRYISYTLIEKAVDSDLDSLHAEEEYFEGKRSLRFTSYYERNLKLRTAAIAYHGTKCMVCGFDFGEFYGERGVGYIEVHHLCLVSSLGQETKVDPKTDMAVVCSNCHRMIHRRRDNVLSLEEMKELVRKSGNTANAHRYS